MGYTLNTVLCFGLLVIFYVVRRQRQRHAAHRRGGCAPPVKHQPMEPFTGFDFQMKMHVNIPTLYHLHQRYGDTFHVNTLVSHPAVITIAKENIQVINTSKDFGVEPMRLAGMEYFCGKGFITTDGDMWKNSIRMLRPSFDGNNLRDLSVLQDEVDWLISFLRKDGTTVNLQPLFYTTFLNSALHFILGIRPSVESDDAPLPADEFVKSFHEALVYSMFRTILGRAWHLLPQGKYRKTCAKAHEFLDFHIERAIQEQNLSKMSEEQSLYSKQSLMRVLSSQTQDREFIRYQILQGMMAAQDTTSELLTNVFFQLARHPDIWKRLRAEVAERGDELLEFDKLTSSKMINNILSETLRLCPIFPLLGRMALQDTTLPTGGGPSQNLPIFVPKDTMIVMSYYALHRNKSVFGTDVDTFRPDRWDDVHASKWEFLGFGAGSRACLGQQKALIEASYVLVRFARAFERIEGRDGREWEGELKLTCKSKNGCKVAFRRDWGSDVPSSSDYRCFVARF